MAKSIIKKIKDYKEGMKIPKNCIIRNMPSEIYHSSKGLSTSGLKTLLDCPAKYYYKYLSGEYEPKEKPYFKIGKAAHCYLLEGKETFEKIYWHNPYSTLNKDEKVQILVSTFGYDEKIKSAKVAEIDEFLLSAAGIEPKEIHLTESELNQVVNMARSAKSDKKVNNALSQLGEAELSLFWYDEEFDIQLKCRPDFLPYNPINVSDYKTSETARPEAFYKKFIDYGYHIQAAMYRRGIRALFGIEVENFFFIVEEKEAPYVTQIFNPADNFYRWGEKAIKNAVEKYKECKKTGLWIGYTDKVVELTTEPMPEYLNDYYDRNNGIVYAPNWIDKLFEKYEV